MKKILLVLLAAVCCAPAYAAQDEALNFYQRQALMRGDGSRADRAFASALAPIIQDSKKLFAAQSPPQASPEQPTAGHRLSNLFVPH